MCVFVYFGVCGVLCSVNGGDYCWLCDELFVVILWCGCDVCECCVGWWLIFFVVVCWWLVCVCGWCECVVWEFVGLCVCVCVVDELGCVCDDGGVVVVYVWVCCVVFGVECDECVDVCVGVCCGCVDVGDCVG